MSFANQDSILLRRTHHHQPGSTHSTPATEEKKIAGEYRGETSRDVLAKLGRKEKAQGVLARAPRQASQVSDTERWG